jgi:hypothetical protein
MAEELVIRDFSYAELSYPFRIGDDVFHALPDVPLGMMGDIAKLSNVQSAVAEHGVDLVIDLFVEFLDEPSGELFRKRVNEKKIGVKKITEILPWILERIGLRPTQPSSDSSTGLGDGETGTSSTDGVPLEDSIL